jgi:hypothetical protein
MYGIRVATRFSFSRESHDGTSLIDKEALTSSANKPTNKIRLILQPKQQAEVQLY